MRRRAGEHYVKVGHAELVELAVELVLSNVLAGAANLVWDDVESGMMADFSAASRRSPLRVDNQVDLSSAPCFLVPFIT